MGAVIFIAPNGKALAMLPIYEAKNCLTITKQRYEKQNSKLFGKRQ